jgi:hypothetical protein
VLAHARVRTSASWTVCRSGRLTQRRGNHDEDVRALDLDLLREGDWVRGGAEDAGEPVRILNRARVLAELSVVCKSQR